MGPRVEVTDSVPAVAAASTPATQAIAASGVSQAVSKVVHRELSPLFEPNEGRENEPGSQDVKVVEASQDVKVVEASVDLSVPKFDMTSLQTTEGANSTQQVS